MDRQRVEETEVWEGEEVKKAVKVMRMRRTSSRRSERNELRVKRRTKGR